MSQFAAYCIFTRNPHSKQAGTRAMEAQSPGFDPSKRFGGDGFNSFMDGMSAGAEELAKPITQPIANAGKAVKSWFGDVADAGRVLSGRAEAPASNPYKPFKPVEYNPVQPNDASRWLNGPIPGGKQASHTLSIVLATKQADWKSDLFNTIKENPIMAGTAIGGLGGAATGMFSGNMLRNGLIGAGLGAGAGAGYKWMGNRPDEGPMGPPAPNPLHVDYNKPQAAKPSQVKLPAGGSKTLEEGSQEAKATLNTPTKKPGVTEFGKPKLTLDMLKGRGEAGIAFRQKTLGQMQDILKGTNLEGKDPFNLSITDKLLLSKEDKEMLEILKGQMDTPDAPGPGPVGKAVAGVGGALDAAVSAPGEWIDSWQESNAEEERAKQERIDKMRSLR